MAEVVKTTWYNINLKVRNSYAAIVLQGLGDPLVNNQQTKRTQKSTICLRTTSIRYPLYVFVENATFVLLKLF